ncbi:unnamed protein product [Orchesella dallaii]|uniref:Uncharacterized protein n=1 Tax=Orchesella dallaii TaxID=48710 RepID=A0ABP1Q4E5_9HEXA
MFKFMGRRQNVGETVHQFMAALPSLATHCQFKDLEERLRDQFIFGLRSEEAQRRRFTKKDDIALKDALPHVAAHEAAEINTSLIRSQQQGQPGELQVNKASQSRSHNS